MEKEMAGLCIDDGEEEAWLIPMESGSKKFAYDFCLVNCFLTASVVHFPTMRNAMANLWHPLGGVQITDLGDRCYLLP